VWLNDPKFIKVKVTIIYLIFGGLLGFGLLQGKSYLTYALKPKAIASMRLSMEGWMIMTRRLTAFFFALAIVNEVIWRNFSTESWVYFKTFGLTIAIFGFFLAQGALFKTHSVGDET